MGTFSIAFGSSVALVEDGRSRGEPERMCGELAIGIGGCLANQDGLPETNREAPPTVFAVGMNRISEIPAK